MLGVIYIVLLDLSGILGISFNDESLFYSISSGIFWTMRQSLWQVTITTLFYGLLIA